MNRQDVTSRTRCERTDLLVRECAHCKGLREEPATPASMGNWFTARYDGRCSYCKTEFVAGDEIRADGEGGFLAECCGEDGS